MRLTKYIPNFLTSMNVFCGTLAIYMAFTGYFKYAAICIFLGALFDFSDGFAARLFKAYSEIGKQLDSLADMVSFTVAPAVLLSVLMSKLVVCSSTGDIVFEPFYVKLMVLFPFIIAIFGALRLAKFNIDTRQTESFLGLTTTATGLFVASFVYMIDKGNSIFLMFLNPWIIIGMSVVFSALLVSEIPMFSLKFKNYSIKDNIDKYVLLLLGAVSLVLFNFGGIAITILLYIVFSISKYWINKED